MPGRGKVVVLCSSLEPKSLSFVPIALRKYYGGLALWQDSSIS